MTIARFVGGLAAFLAGVVVMASIPPVDSAAQLAVGWALMLAGICTSVPAALDLLGVE